MNPLLIGAGLVSFAGVVVPYSQMQPFWKYWLYWLGPFHYLVGGLFGTVVWDVQVQCRPDEFTVFDVPSGQTCGEYMAGFLSSNAGYVADPSDRGSCSYCAYATGAEYAQTFNLKEEYYAWRDVSVLKTRSLRKLATSKLTIVTDWHHGPVLPIVIRAGLLDDEAEEQEDQER